MNEPFAVRAQLTMARQQMDGDGNLEYRRSVVARGVRTGLAGAEFDEQFATLKHTQEVDDELATLCKAFGRQARRIFCRT